MCRNALPCYVLAEARLLISFDARTSKEFLEPVFGLIVPPLDGFGALLEMWLGLCVPPLWLLCLVSLVAHRLMKGSYHGCTQIGSLLAGAAVDPLKRIAKTSPAPKFSEASAPAP